MFDRNPIKSQGMYFTEPPPATTNHLQPAPTVYNCLYYQQNVIYNTRLSYALSSPGLGLVENLVETVKNSSLDKENLMKWNSILWDAFQAYDLGKGSEENYPKMVKKLTIPEACTKKYDS